MALPPLPKRTELTQQIAESGDTLTSAIAALDAVVSTRTLQVI